jgi:hypothetical protein
VEKEFGVKGRVPVKCLFDKVEYTGSLVKMGAECHIIGITKDIRAKIGKDIGDTVSVKIIKDDAERTAEVPPALEKILKKDKKLAEAYNKLSYTNKKEIFIALSEAKKPETSDARLQKIVVGLSAKK